MICYCSTLMKLDTTEKRDWSCRQPRQLITPACWPLRTERARCPQVLIRSLLVFTLVLLQASICHASSSLRLPLSRPLFPSPWAPLLLLIDPSFLAKEHNRGMIPTSILEPLKQKAQHSRNRPTAPSEKALLSRWRRRKVDRLEMVLQLCSGTKQCHFIP